MQADPKVPKGRDQLQVNSIMIVAIKRIDHVIAGRIEEMRQFHKRMGRQCRNLMSDDSHSPTNVGCHARLKEDRS